MHEEFAPRTVTLGVRGPELDLEAVKRDAEKWLTVLGQAVGITKRKERPTIRIRGADAKEKKLVVDLVEGLVSYSVPVDDAQRDDYLIFGQRKPALLEAARRCVVQLPAT